MQGDRRRQETTAFALNKVSVCFCFWSDLGLSPSGLLDLIGKFINHNVILNFLWLTWWLKYLNGDDNLTIDSGLRVTWSRGSQVQTCKQASDLLLCCNVQDLAPKPKRASSGCKDQLYITLAFSHKSFSRMMFIWSMSIECLYKLLV